MKYLFGDSFLQKVKKVPSFVWILAYAVSLFAANWQDYISESKLFSAELMPMYESAGMSANENVIFFFLIILFVMISTAFFEIIARWISNSMIRKFRLSINANDLVMRLRLILGLGNLILGIIHLTYLINDNAGYIVSSATDFAVMFVLLLWFYSDFRKTYVPAAYQRKLFSYVATLILSITIIIGAVLFAYYGMSADYTMTPIDIAGFSVDLGVKLLCAGAAVLYARSLSKHETNDIGAPQGPKVFIADDPFGFEKQEKKDDKIFKDFDI